MEIHATIEALASIIPKNISNKTLGIILLTLLNLKINVVLKKCLKVCWKK